MLPTVISDLISNPAVAIAILIAALSIAAYHWKIITPIVSRQRKDMEEEERRLQNLRTSVDMVASHVRNLSNNYINSIPSNNNNSSSGPRKPTAAKRGDEYESGSSSNTDAVPPFIFDHNVLNPSSSSSGRT
ncbi:hypothetical protein Gasu2_33720 [Galdieria sulphuraria]|nr:hypothetical protein Gasu2_33720 [Galdieria sulphuraria]